MLPTPIVLDTLELPYETTRSLLRHVARLAPRHRLALLCAHRPGIGLGPGFPRLALEATAAGAATDRLLALPADVREALAQVAAAGPSFDQLEFQATSGADADRGHRMLDLALASGVIAPVADGGFRFAEPDDAARLAASLPRHRRSAMHRSAARVLHDLGAPPERVATHLLAA